MSPDGSRRADRSGRPLHVFFLIRSLGRGGAERQLVMLARALGERGLRVTVATFYDDGALRPELEGAPGVRILELGKAGRWDWLGFTRRLLSGAREDRPDVVHGYMGTANELCLLLGRALGVPVVWGIRASFLDRSGHDWVPRVAFRVGVLLSGLPDLCVFNSRAGYDYHLAAGFRPRRHAVVPNGIDVARFAPDPEARTQLRAQWGVGDDQVLVGLVGRIDPMKDIGGFVDAAARLAQRRPEVRFVVVGSGDEALLGRLQARPSVRSLGDRLRWEPARPDVQRVYAALDVSTSTSLGEGFSNAIAEAMAVGTPVVATDVGDSAWIVGPTGEVVAAGNPAGVVDGWQRLLGRIAAEGAASISAAARRRVVENFGVEALTHAMIDLLEDVVAGAGGRD